MFHYNYVISILLELNCFVVIIVLTYLLLLNIIFYLLSSAC